MAGSHHHIWLTGSGSMTSLSSSLSNLTTIAVEASCVHLYTLQEGVCRQQSFSALLNLSRC